MTALLVMVLSSQCTWLYYLDCNWALLLSLHKRAGAWAKYFLLQWLAQVWLLTRWTSQMPSLAFS